MNLLRLAAGLHGAVVQGTDGPVVAMGTPTSRLLGVRPEDVRVAAGPGVRATVVSVEYLGADSIVTCRLGSETLAMRLSGRSDLAPGTALSLEWPPEAVHVFDEATGLRCDAVAARPLTPTGAVR